MRTPALWIGACLLLFSCGRQQDRSWTAERAAAPILGKLDQDGNGSVRRKEFIRRTMGMPAFEEVDQDRDGHFESDEVVSILGKLDPARFQGGPNKRSQPRPEDGEVIFPTPWASRNIRDLLRFMRADVLDRDPDRALPDDQAILAASASGELTAPECLSVLQQLETAYGELGMSFPAGLEALLAESTAGAAP